MGRFGWGMRGAAWFVMLGLGSSPARATVCQTYTNGTLTCGASASGRINEGATNRIMSYTGCVSDQSTIGSVYGASASQRGGEKFYTFVCPMTARVTFTVAQTPCDVDAFVLGETCGPTTSCLAIKEDFDSPAVIWTDCVAGETRHLVIDAWALGERFNNPAHYLVCGGALGSKWVDYSVRASCSEDCANGRDDDGDGSTDCTDVDCIGQASCCDFDGDGYDHNSAACGGNDCDDLNADINPGEPDIPANGVDENCNGRDACYEDADRDGFGSTRTVAGGAQPCAQLPGKSDNSRDCDDGNAAIKPGAAELVADGVDQDCDGADACFRDADLDGFGAPGTSVPGADLTCATGGVSPEGTDCRDAGAGADSVWPGAPELCDGLDNDCDGLVDDADPDRVGASSWFRDGDGDGVGAGVVVSACAAPPGHVAASGDCDDGASSVRPGAVEVAADGVDQDCDGGDRCFVDADDDGVGSAVLGAAPGLDCVALTGWSPVSGDCADDVAAVRPGADEVCNGVDDDCDGAVDDADAGRIGGQGWWEDLDGDGAGAGVPVITCVAPVGRVSDDGDCDDGEPAIRPGADESCDGVDEDCDGSVDEDVVVGIDAFVDADGDGFGGAGAVMPACELLPGFVAVAGDCDDGDAAVAPGADEVCNGVDDDCDGLMDDADPDRVGGTSWWLDDDGDGAPGGLPVVACAAPPGAGPVPTDCDDADAAVGPGAVEVCNGQDDDCDGLTDDADPGVVAGTAWFVDGDGDGAPGDVSVAACQPPAGSGPVATDCDDDSASVHPGAEELCNGVDDDCDGLVDGEDVAAGLAAWVDADGDGYGDPARPAACGAAAAVGDNTDCDDGDGASHPGAVEEPYDGVDQDCDGADVNDVDQDGVDWPADCDDQHARVRPGQIETPDGVDEDCDGLVDEGTDRYDDDGDGFAELGGDCDDGDAGVSPAAVETCDRRDEDCDGRVDEGTGCADDDLDGFSENQGDCNDSDPTVSPGATERPGDGVDRDCDGRILPADQDGDGWTASAGDCDDADPTRRPGAAERLNGRDDDCDGVVDEGTVVFDDDFDGVSEAQGDCHDGDPLVSPAALERVNGVDDDCDGVIDEGSGRTDDDGDGFSEDGGDCDDADDRRSPGGVEVVNGVDDDCDGVIDEGADDHDGDGYRPEQGDCDDNDGWANPGQVEMCDGIDNDCDEQVDEIGCDDEGVPLPPSSGGRSCSQVGHGVEGIGLLGLLWARRRRLASASAGR